MLGDSNAYINSLRWFLVLVRSCAFFGHSETLTTHKCFLLLDKFEWQSKLKNHETELRLNDCAATLPLETLVAVLNLVWKLVGRASCISNEITSIRFKMPLTSLAETRKAVFTHKRALVEMNIPDCFYSNDIFAASSKAGCLLQKIIYMGSRQLLWNVVR